MDDGGAFLSSAVNVEWTNKQGTLTRKATHRKANMRLIRSSNRDIYVEVVADKSATVKLRLKGISVHKKFANEGKASIKFNEENATMYISNAPPGQLVTFLRTLFVKMTGQEPAKNKDASLRTQLLSNKHNQFDEISPVTTTEYNRALMKANRAATAGTSPLTGNKRKLERDSTEKPQASKKLMYTPSPIPTEPLDIEQKDVLDACKSGVNVFFTGSAGTGKSYLLKRIIRALPPDVTVATASTGVAACHIGGITLHQFAGIGGDDVTLERSIGLASKPPTCTNWRKVKHLIIDEISMVDGGYFEKIEHIARVIRKNDKPFGGIQLILCGDFLQLPPVSKLDKKVLAKFCFQTKAWEACRLVTFELKRVHRQNDDKFISILNKIRIGDVDQRVSDILSATAKQKIERDGILATRLCTHTKDADLINQSKLNALEGESKLFEAQDAVPGTTKHLDQQTSVPSRLELKIGAQVMLLKNINVSAGLVNGARGVVKTFKDDLPVVQFRNKREYVAAHEKWTVKTAAGALLIRKQVPLKLAWAFSIHKAQGLTLDCVEMCLSRVFEPGQAYVALSRAQSLETLRVLDFKASQVWANPDVLQFYRTLDQMRLVPLGPTDKKIAMGKSGNVRKKVGLKSKMFDKPLVSIS